MVTRLTRTGLTWNGSVYEKIGFADIDPTRLAETKEAVIFAIQELDLPRPIEIDWLRMIEPRPGRHMFGLTPSAPIFERRLVYLVNYPLAPYTALHELRHLWQLKRVAEGDREVAAWLSFDKGEADAHAYQLAAFARLFGKKRGLAMAERMYAEARTEGFLREEWTCQPLEPV